MRIRPYVADDGGDVLDLAERLAIGVARWRDSIAVDAAVEGWLRDSIAAVGRDAAIFVADDDGRVCGVVSVSTRTHFTGQVDAYVGELVVSAPYERRGIGRALMERAERWARDRGLEHLTIETGAANLAAREFYGRLGYVEEDVRLTRELNQSRGPNIAG